jgi:hypothetical protein
MELLKAMVINRLYGGGSALHGGHGAPRVQPKPAVSQPAKTGA